MSEHAKDYNPLQHSVVQAIAGTWSQFECDDFIEALLDKILDEIRRVHWNVYQHQWDATWHGDEVEDPEIPGISFVRFYQDRCDCGGQFPHHAPDCEWKTGHADWNRERLRWATVPKSEDEREEEIAQRKRLFGEDNPMAYLIGDQLYPQKLFGEYPVPHPPCTCGASDAFDEDRGCLPTCIGRRPNFQFEDVEIRWYKRPGRGMSTNKDWTSDEWRAWFNRCLAKVREFDVQMSEADHERCEKLRSEFVSKYPKQDR